MQQLIALIDYKSNEIHKEWEQLFDITVVQTSKMYKVPIYYEVRINYNTLKVELLLINLISMEWYNDLPLRQTIINALIRPLETFVLEDPPPNT